MAGGSAGNTQMGPENWRELFLEATRSVYEGNWQVAATPAPTINSFTAVLRNPANVPLSLSSVQVSALQGAIVEWVSGALAGTATGPLPRVHVRLAAITSGGACTTDAMPQAPAAGDQFILRSPTPAAGSGALSLGAQINPAVLQGTLRDQLWLAMPQDKLTANGAWWRSSSGGPGWIDVRRYRRILMLATADANGYFYIQESWDGQTVLLRPDSFRLVIGSAQLNIAGSYNANLPAAALIEVGSPLIEPLYQNGPTAQNNFYFAGFGIE